MLGMVTDLEARASASALNASSKLDSAHVQWNGIGGYFYSDIGSA